MYVPWRRVLSWHCSACGVCCKKFKPKLTFYEYLKLKHTGFVEERSGRYYIKKIGGRCPFQVGNVCILQNKMKPISCMVFPFLVKKKGELDALYEYGNEEFYVYVSTDCPNTVIKPKFKIKSETKSTHIESLVREAIEIVTGEKRKVELITANNVAANF